MKSTVRFFPGALSALLTIAMILVFSSVSPLSPFGVAKQSTGNGLIGALASGRLSGDLTAGTVLAPPIKIFAFVPGSFDAPLAGRQKIARLIAASGAPVDGISWRLPWSKLEPADGKFNWGPVDDILKATTGVKKLTMLRVIAGMDSPTWVNSISKTISFPNTALHNPSAYPPTVTMPLPWDSTYLGKWAAFIRAYGNRYDGNIHIYSVQMTGLGLIGDMYLPNTIIPKWLAAGFTDANMIAAAKSITRSYQNAFPITRTALDIAEPLSGYSNVLAPVMKYLFANFSSIYVQQNGLKSKEIKVPNSPLRTFIRQAGTVYGTGGYQMNGSITDDPTIGPANTAFKVAIEDQVAYVEIYDKDILNKTLIPAMNYLVAPH